MNHIHIRIILFGTKIQKKQKQIPIYVKHKCTERELYGGGGVCYSQLSTCGIWEKGAIALRGRLSKKS